MLLEFNNCLIDECTIQRYIKILSFCFIERWGKAGAQFYKYLNTMSSLLENADSPNRDEDRPTTRENIVVVLTGLIKQRGWPSLRRYCCRRLISEARRLLV